MKKIYLFHKWVRSERFPIATAATNRQPYRGVEQLGQLARLIT